MNYGMQTSKPLYFVIRNMYASINYREARPYHRCTSLKTGFVVYV